MILFGKCVFFRIVFLWKPVCFHPRKTSLNQCLKKSILSAFTIHWNFNNSYRCSFEFRCRRCFVQRTILYAFLSSIHIGKCSFFSKNRMESCVSTWDFRHSNSKENTYSGTRTKFEPFKLKLSTNPAVSKSVSQRNSIQRIFSYDSCTKDHFVHFFFKLLKLFDRTKKKWCRFHFWHRT